MATDRKWGSGRHAERQRTGIDRRGVRLLRRGVQLVPRFPRLKSSVPHRLTRPTWAPFRVRAPARYPAGYPRRPAQEPITTSRFPAAFQPPAFASWVVLRPLQAPAFLTVGLPDDASHADPDRNGVIALHTGQTRPGWVPPQPRDGGVLPAGLHYPAGACRFPTASPTPRCGYPSAESIVTRHHQGFTHVHPSGLPLTCSPRMERGPSGLNPELRTPPSPATHVRAGTGHRTLTRDCAYGISRTSSPQPTEPEHPRVAHADQSPRTAVPHTLPLGPPSS
jgi:hypothetical protein